MARFAEWLKIQPGEGRRTLLLFGVFYFTSIGSALGSNGIDALLFARFGVQYLPVLFIALGLTTVVATLIITAVLGRGARERFYVRLALGLGLALVIARLGLMSGARAVFPVIWLGMNVGNSCQGILTWGLAGAAVDSRQAKRLFPLFAAGGILGLVSGGLLTRPAAALVHSENLILAWAVALAFAFICGVVLLRDGGPATPPHKTSLIKEAQQGFVTVRRSPMLTWLALAVILFALLYATLQFPFARAATQTFHDADSLAGFLGVFQAVTTGVAFVASLVIANRLFARIGLMNAVLGFGLIYLAVFVVLAVNGGFWVLVGGRFLNLAYMFGIAGTAYHALFNVVPGERRDQARTFLDGVPAQLGTAAAGGMLALVQYAQPIVMYSIGIVCSSVLVVSLMMARREYATALLSALKAGRPVIFPDAGSVDADRAEADAIARSLEIEAEEDAALLALERSSSLPPTLRSYAESRRDSALRYRRQLGRLAVDGGPAVQLLARSVEVRAHRHATRALRAAALLRGRPLTIAVEGLGGRDPALRALALETLDSLAEPAIVKPLLPVFEASPRTSAADPKVIEELTADSDGWIRDCAGLASGVEHTHMETGSTVPVMERIQFLSRVPLFAEIDPADLRSVAEIAAEHVFKDGEEVVKQGDPGDQMYVIVDGEMKVMVDGKPVASRKSGDHVGEMAVLTREPRMATLVASGRVRALGVSQAQFESMLRERPAIGLAVIATLCTRLRERDEADQK